MSKFYTASSQAKELCEEAKTAKEKNKKLNKEVLSKKGEVIRLTKDLNCLHGVETKLKSEVEELKADSVEKETRIVHLEGQISAFNSSLEKAREEAVVAFKKSDEYKNRLDGHYATGYEDFCADAKEAFPDLDFDSLKIPLATESSLLPTSFKDVNVMEDATNEVTQDTTVASKDVPKSGGDAYLTKFIFLLEKFYHFSFFFFFGNARCFGLYFFRIHSSTISSSKFMDEVYIQLPLLAFHNQRVFGQ